MSFAYHILKTNSLKRPTVLITCVAGLKNVKLPPNYDHIKLPDKPRLPFVEKVPQFGTGSGKPLRTHKHLNLISGAEEVHNALIHKQYGIVATGGGRLNFRHFENIRMNIVKTMDIKKMFAIWRVDPPWLPVSKKGIGQRMGGGKGAINYYVTPVKRGRIILEIGGHCEFEEAYPILKSICHRLPFDAIPCSQQTLEDMKKEEEREKTENLNPYTFEYMVKNNMANVRRWASPRVDYKYFGKYI